MFNLRKLQKWYHIHCDGDWEHIFGITIETLDNPGWSIKINLEDTLLEDVEFTGIEEGDSESKTEPWITCYKEEGNFIGRCSAEQLEVLIKIFIKWAKKNTDTRSWNEDVKRLMKECKSARRNNKDIEDLRKIFYEIEDIPYEHTQREKLVKLFYKCWNKAINDNNVVK